MSRARMQSSPRPTCGRRVVAGKRPRPDDYKNCVRKLLKREISRAGNWAFNRTNSQEKFRNFHLQVALSLDIVPTPYPFLLRALCVPHRTISLWFWAGFKLTFLLVHKLNLCEDVDIVLKSSVFIIFVQMQFV
jgi:hypothetical protein